MPPFAGVAENLSKSLHNGSIFALFLKNRTMIRLIFPLLFLFACSTAEKSTMNEEVKNDVNRLHDIWALQSIDGVKMPDNLSKHPTIEIYVSDKRVSGNDGCNNIGGNIKVLTENEIVFGVMFGTKMACPNMDFSRDYNKKLSETVSYSLKNLDLILFDINQKELLRFKKVD